MNPATDFIRSGSYPDVKLDWLDVTIPKDHAFPVYRQLAPILAAECESSHGGHYWIGGGTVKLGPHRGVDRLSLSGASIRVLEMVPEGLQTILAILSEVPHRVTRLDAALDLPVDGADQLDYLRERYPRDSVRLTQRPIKVKNFLSARESDGRSTGTWYAGHRSGAEVTCRVYDKALQMWDTHGVEWPPTTRFELTVRKGPGPTLRDAAQPTRLFWHYMSPAILEAPANVPEWQPGWAEGWKMERHELEPAAALKRRIEHSGELPSLVELADSMGPEGRTVLKRWLGDAVDELDSYSRSYGFSEPTGTDGV